MNRDARLTGFTGLPSGCGLIGEDGVDIAFALVLMESLALEERRSRLAGDRSPRFRRSKIVMRDSVGIRLAYPLVSMHPLGKSAGRTK